MDNIFQSKEWEDFKLSTGYQKSYRVNNILILEKSLPLRQSMLYSPMVSSNSLSNIKEKNFLSEIGEISRKANSIFYRLELDISTGLSGIDPTKLGFVKAFEEMQPEHTLTLDLTKNEEEILAQMKQKGRYNIRIAEREGIILEQAEATGAELDDFYRLYSETGKRHKITYRAKSYFDSLLEILSKSGYARVYTAYFKNKSEKTALASAIIVYSGKKAIYMFGSSSDEYKNMMAPYKLHWEIIKEAKEAGFETYDFFGIAPDDDPGHPWAGVTRFKKQFGGEQVNVFGSYDYIFSPTKYKLFKIAEKIRR